MNHADDIPDLYIRHAAAWAKARDARFDERAWLDKCLCHLSPGASVLDLGCGHGAPVARHFIAAGCAVTGVDTSAPLLDLAQAALPQGTWHHRDMRGLDLGATFDAILAWDSFFHLTPGDQRGMFAVFARHAAPGAMLMFTTGPSASVKIGSFEGDAMYHASLNPGTYRDLLSRHGFGVVDHIPQDPQAGGRTPWLAQFICRKK